MEEAIFRRSELLTINPSAEITALQKTFTEEKLFPKRKFQCVYSDELLQAKDEGKGSLVHITAIFGFMLAGLVIQDATKL